MEINFKGHVQNAMKAEEKEHMSLPQVKECVTEEGAFELRLNGSTEVYLVD